MNGRIMHRQRGAVLMIVLVALLAMLISVMALSRSMDTHQMVAGNLAFRNSTVHSTDAGVLNAVQWLQGVAGTVALNNHAPENGYFAAVIEPNWDDELLWNECAGCTVAGDEAGNQVQWMVHRMCAAEGNTNAAGNSCSLLRAASAAAAGGSFSADAVNFTGIAQNYYRITVRVTGPRNTSTLVQTFVTL